ncbi:endodeoxyribonuclease RUS [Afipia felis]|uniref:Endodeoxyribonuclease RUS n=1 Tax=Afipia felis TaxID=1035 RepID=A0A090MMX8_AFIFE|nr:RusA family crossover junction endodeoxyribonuclease [Afipia felis]CEG08736.1 endodeoxyribonuclease RUS [Afipia felis]
MVTLTLPFPVSANRLWRTGNGRTYLSPQYRAWKDEALAAYLLQKRDVGTPITGNFTYHITLDEKKRKQARDGDNRGKGVLDFLQAVGLIQDDKYADAGSWSWGPIEPGTCFVRLFPKASA